MKWERGSEGLASGNAWELLNSVTKLGSRTNPAWGTEKEIRTWRHCSETAEHQDNVEISKTARGKQNLKGRTIERRADLSTATGSTKLQDTAAGVPRSTNCQPGTKTGWIVHYERRPFSLRQKMGSVKQQILTNGNPIECTTGRKNEFKLLTIKMNLKI